MRLIPGMVRRTPDPRNVHGTAGAGLVDATWAANPTVARIGRDGEIRTARLLNDHRPSDTAVLHDLAVPAAGYTANIDHAVVSGNRVLLIDTKAWRSGRYWTLLGGTRRGWQRFGHADTRTPAMARDRIARMLASRGIAATVLTPLVAVWPSSPTGTVSVRWLRMHGCTPIAANALPRRIRRIIGNHPADPRVLNALTELVGRTGQPTRIR